MCLGVFFRKLSRPWLRNAALGYVAGATFFLCSLHWLTTVHAVGWIALSLYLALFFAAWGWFAGGVTKDREFLTSRRNLLVALQCAAAWTALEWLRGWLFSGFGWNGLGIALHGDLACIQTAEFTGVAGLTFLVCLANIITVVTVRRFIAEAGRRRIRPHWDFSATVLLVALNFAFGVRVLLKKETPGTQIRVAAIQPNIPQNEKWDDSFAQSIVERLRDLTVPALALQPELLLWPEASVPGGAFSSREAADFVKSFCADSDVNFLIGTSEFGPDGDFNSAALLNRRGARLQTYRKIHLVPFGEFIPFRHSFPLFAWITGDLVPGDFSAGSGFTILETERPAVKIAALICFEDTLGDLTRRFVQRGAQLLVNLTNDGWFLESPAAEQHLANAVFRAVETRRPLLRCANTGVTCLVDTRGRVTHALRDGRGSHFTAGMLSAKVGVPDGSVQTFHTRHGEWLAALCGLIALAGCAVRFVRK
jgi:apolipoprotein N-acyltransferase